MEDEIEKTKQEKKKRKHRDGDGQQTSNETSAISTVQPAAAPEAQTSKKRKLAPKAITNPVVGVEFVMPRGGLGAVGTGDTAASNRFPTQPASISNTQPSEDQNVLSEATPSNPASEEPTGSKAISGAAVVGKVVEGYGSPVRLPAPHKGLCKLLCFYAASLLE